MIWTLLQDAFFAAIAAIGFSSVSNPPRRAYLYCAVIAAIAHSMRRLLIDAAGWHIVAATPLAALVVGILAVVLSPRSLIPAETYLYPSLLPMIPGIYAYKAFGALVMCLQNSAEQGFMHYFYLFADNALICFLILLGMVTGATLPIFLLSQITFRATRS